jgi:hypothetical protein
MTFDFIATRLCADGVLKPPHQRWTGEQRGALFVSEKYDAEHSRSVRVARLLNSAGADLLPPLHDVQLISAKPDWWVLSGFERSAAEFSASTRSVAQSWVLIPAGVDTAPQVGTASPGMA